MNVRFGSYTMLLLASLLLVFLVSCKGASNDQPATLPPDSPPAGTITSLPASEQRAMDEFVKQQQAINREWDQLHQEFDRWRAGLTACHSSSVHEAIQDFAARFTGVTERARDLPRASITRELADILIAATEEEEAAFRQLRDRWQPNNVSLFELVEQQRSAAARAQKKVEDQAMELQEKFEKSADLEEVRALEEFSNAFDVVKNDWNKFHDDYAELQKEADNLDNTAVLARLDQLSGQVEAILEAVYGLPSADATESMVEMLQEAVEAEFDALFDVIAASQTGGVPAFVPTPAPIPTARPRAVPTATAPPLDTSPTIPPPPTATPPGLEPGRETGSPLDLMDVVIEQSEAVLKEVSRTIKALVDDSPAENLADVQDFNDNYRVLLAEWDAFHQRYNDWRRTAGGCDRTGVLQALDQFNLRVGELGRKVRDLPQSSYLLPMYTLLVQAVEREEGAFRALRNSWRPFTVDAFKAVDQERVNANRLRRQADIGLEGLRNRS